MLLQLNQARTFNPQLIDMMAAEVFWGYCYRTEVSDRNQLRPARRLRKTVDAAEGGGAAADVSEVSSDTAKRFYNEANEYMQNKASREENIIGTLYTEDFGPAARRSFAQRNCYNACVPPVTRRWTSIRVHGGRGRFADPHAAPGGRAAAGEAASERDSGRRHPESPGLPENNDAAGSQRSPLPDNPEGYGYSATGVFQIPCRDRYNRPRLDQAHSQQQRLRKAGALLTRAGGVPLILVGSPLLRRVLFTQSLLIDAIDPLLVGLLVAPFGVTRQATASIKEIPKVIFGAGHGRSNSMETSCRPGIKCLLWRNAELMVFAGICKNRVRAVMDQKTDIRFFAYRPEKA